MCVHTYVNKFYILILSSEFIPIHLEILKLKQFQFTYLQIDFRAKDLSASLWNLSVRQPEQPGSLPWVVSEAARVVFPGLPPSSPSLQPLPWFSLPCVSVTSAQPSLPGLITPHQESTRQRFAALSGPWERRSAAPASSISRRMPASLSYELISFSYYSDIILKKRAPALSSWFPIFGGNG